MTTEYEYIYFEKIEDKAKTSVWSCKNKKSKVELGKVFWNSGWRQYVFSPTGPSIYSVGCLDDISDFIGELAMERKLVEKKWIKE